MLPLSSPASAASDACGGVEREQAIEAQARRRSAQRRMSA
jgi:hypothetical protein